MKHLLAVFIVVIAMVSMAIADGNDSDSNATQANEVSQEDLRYLISEGEANLAIATISTCYWEWEPKQDITVYELALLLPILIHNDNYEAIEYLPLLAKRHLKKVCD